MSTSNSWFAAIGLVVVAVPAVLALTIISLAWRAWWLYPAWEWFIVPLGAPTVSFWHFTALLLIIGTMKTIDIKKDDRETELGSLVVVVLWPIAVWLLLRGMR